VLITSISPNRTATLDWAVFLTAFHLTALGLSAFVTYGSFKLN
jgi:hypothetical protein